MKKRTFIALFITINLLFIFLYIHKQSTIIKLSFEKQRNEKLKEELMLQKNTLIQQLHTLNTKPAIKEHAAKTLGMKKIDLKQITVIADE